MPDATLVLLDTLRIPRDFRPGAPLVVLLHGRGADKEDLVSLAEFFPAGAAAAFPQAPFPAAPWGYGPGYAWYRFLGGARPEPESFAAGQEALIRYLDELPARLPHSPGPIILGGFSQGGTSALAWALGHPGRVAGVLMLSGFLAEHPSVAVSAETARDLEVFWGHGTQDGNIPHPLGEQGRAALRGAGARVEAHDYPMGHTIVREEMEDARSWMDAKTLGDIWMPTTMGFHHVTMVSGNAARTVRFYREALGLGLVKRTVNFDDPSAYHLYFGLEGGKPGTLLTFFDWSGAPKGHPGIGGVHHVALGVADEASLLKWKRRLNDRGIPTTGPIDRGYFRSLYFADPDGQILELATAGPGYAIDEPADALGRVETLPDPNQLQRSPKARTYALRIHPEPVPAITPEMAISGIHHISAITSDVARANEFYGNSLGLRLIKKSVNQDDPGMPHHFWARYENGKVEPHSSWTMFGFPPGWHQARGGAGQTHHVAFRAKDSEEQLAWRESLLGSGVPVSPVMDRTYFTSIYFQDPDGLLLEIATDGPGFSVDEDPEMLGERLALPAWLEAGRPEIEKHLVALP